MFETGIIGKSLYQVGLNPNYELYQFLAQHNLKTINSRGLFGKTALHYAIKNNNIETTKLLLENGSDVNAPDARDCTPLFYAIDSNNIDIIKLLIEKGASLNSLLEGGHHVEYYGFGESSPLNYALENTKNNKELIALLESVKSDQKNTAPSEITTSKPKNLIVCYNDDGSLGNSQPNHGTIVDPHSNDFGIGSEAEKSVETNY